MIRPRSLGNFQLLRSRRKKTWWRNQIRIPSRFYAAPSQFLIHLLAHVLAGAIWVTKVLAPLDQQV